MRIVSWNINGIRAAETKGFGEWLAAEDADLVFVQEIKAMEEQVPAALREPPGWSAWFHPAERKGYSGVAVYARQDPDEVQKGMGDPRFDCEGRVIGVRYGKLWVFGNYFPNGGQGPERVAYKLDFYAAMLERMNALRDSGHDVVVTGDYNTAHKEIDLARPKENEETSGFLPEEREWVQRYIDEGWVDTFRHVHGDLPDRYSWWSFRANARARNVGWRIDYHFVNQGLLPRVTGADIHDQTQGSDHAPVSLELAL